MNERKALGDYGEELAVKEYRRRRYRILDRGYRTRFGEIDLIAEDREYVVFAEVKLRKDDRFAAASEAVDRGKQQRIRRSAAIWLSKRNTDKQPRFDVVEIYTERLPQADAPEIHIIENAF